MNEAIIVADSSPLIGLARIGQLELLPQLCRRVVVPPAVWEEVTIHGRVAPGAHAVSQAAWLEIQAPNPVLVEPMAILVDRGEAEALALARQMDGSLLLVDDARARRVAERLNVRRIGTLGILRRAKQSGLIDRLRPQVEALLANGIYIRQELIDVILREVGE